MAQVPRAQPVARSPLQRGRSLSRRTQSGIGTPGTPVPISTRVRLSISLISVYDTSSNIHTVDPNVSATPYDLNQGAFYPGTPYSQAPGSTFGGDTTDTMFGGGEGADWNSGSEMWYLPPGAAFFQNVNDQAITQTADGVNVGGMDLLDYMTLGDFTGVEGPNF